MQKNIDEKNIATLSQQLSWSHFKELIVLEKSSIHVAQYLTVLPPREILEAKLHQVIENAKAKYLIDNPQKEK